MFFISLLLQRRHRRWWKKIIAGWSETESEATNNKYMIIRKNSWGQYEERNYSIDLFCILLPPRSDEKEKNFHFFLFGIIFVLEALLCSEPTWKNETKWKMLQKYVYLGKWLEGSILLSYEGAQNCNNAMPRLVAEKIIK